MLNGGVTVLTGWLVEKMTKCVNGLVGLVEKDVLNPSAARLFLFCIDEVYIFHISSKFWVYIIFLGGEFKGDKI